MGWVIDTCVLIDIAIEDVQNGINAVECLEKYSSQGLFISSISLIELAPVFDGEIQRLNKFIEIMGVTPLWYWQSSETQRAAQVWSNYVVRKKRTQTLKRVVADFLIGVSAERVGGLITRNEEDFRIDFPKLKIVHPRMK